MKRKIIVGVVVCLSLGLNVALLVPHVGQEAAFAGSPSGNGDVNADGKLDIADGIYIINYLLRHGPAPATIECAACDSCCPACPPPRLPATGQTTCYDFSGGVINCASAEYPGQDAFYQKGCPTSGRFLDNGDGTVTDSCTGLMWQQATAPGRYTWQDALKYCEGLELAGHDDWRLPNLRELQSIVDYGRCDPAIDPVFEVESTDYWSSSTPACDLGRAWDVLFQVGYVWDGPRDNPYSVLAVRG